MSESDIVASCKRLGIDLSVQPDFVQGLLKWQVLEDLAQVMGGLCRFASADRPDKEEQCIQFHDTIRRIRVEYLYPSDREAKYWYLDQLSRIIRAVDHEMLKLVDKWEHRTVVQDKQTMDQRYGRSYRSAALVRSKHQQHQTRLGHQDKHCTVRRIHRFDTWEIHSLGLSRWPVTGPSEPIHNRSFACRHLRHIPALLGFARHAAGRRPCHHQ